MQEQTYSEKQKNRREYFVAKLEQAEKDSQRYMDLSNDMTRFGNQPILNGHYSQKSSERRFKNIYRSMDKFVEANKKIEYYKHKISIIDKNKKVSAKDEDAVLKLKERLASFENELSNIKKAILFFKNNTTPETIRNTKEWSPLAIDSGIPLRTIRDVLEVIDLHTLKVPTYLTQNINAKIRSTKLRIEKLERQ